MKHRLLISLLLISFNLFGQTERIANWFFGHEAGLNFSTGEPVAITTSKLRSIEGSSSICDTMGNLLFYTNGERVWNRNNELMPNSINLQGNQSAIQASVIAPLPNNDVLYYLFTTSYPDGLHYSIVDMSLNNGLGEISETKNVLLQKNGGEELAGTLHCNGLYYWIVSRELTEDELIFHAHLLTEDGIDDSIVSKFNVTSAIADDWGCITLSQNGTKLIYSTFSRPIYIFDFCLSTGLLELTDSIAVADNEVLYTNALSPNAELLYTTSWVIGGDCLLSQYNLMADNILDTRVNLDFEYYGFGTPNAFGYIGHVKLASDQKIYVSKWHQKPTETIHPGSFYTLDSLSVINQPNNLGLGCEYEENAVYLNGKPTMLGLPNFISSFTTNNNKKPLKIQNVDICEGESYILPDGVEVELEGIYESIITSTQGCDSIITTDLKMFEPVFEEKEVSICVGENHILPDGTEVELEGAYESTITSMQGCDSIITTNVKVFEQLFDEKEVSICIGESHILPDGVKVELEGIYETTISSLQGCDSIITTTVNINSITINMPTELLLESGDIKLVNEIESSNPIEYLWSPPEGLSCFTCPEPLANPAVSTTYLLEVTDVVAGCTASASVSVLSIINESAIPNAFSPNEDGVNDYFIIENIPPDTTFLLVIYNRWGEKVFETKNLNTFWDGIFNNQKQPLGVYVWFLQLEKSDGTIQQLKGNVTLVR